MLLPLRLIWRGFHRDRNQQAAWQTHQRSQMPVDACAITRIYVYYHYYTTGAQELIYLIILRTIYP